MKKIIGGLVALLLLGSSATGYAYEAFKGPLGLLQNEEDKTFKGYTLIVPEKATISYLIDMDGNVINEWKSEYPAFYGELLPNGNLARHAVLKNEYPQSGPFWGGFAGLIEEFDWSGKKVFEYRMYDDKTLSHHTFEVMPNGNYLLLGWEYKSYDEAVAKGLDVSNPDRTLFKEGFKRGRERCMGFWPDFIREVDRQTGKTVWEWHVWDHIGTGPNQIDINKHVPSRVNRIHAGPDWTHFNGLAYNPDTDQICVTSRNLMEVFVIDRKSGDIVFRWGNPANYGQGKAPSGYGDDGDQQLFGPHAPDWTAEGNISILDNGALRPSGNYTRAVELDPRTGKVVWDWRAQNVKADPVNFYSSNESGAQKLPNGNWLITATRHGGHTIEVTPKKEIVWEFINPVGSGNKVYSTSPRHGGISDLIVHKSLRYALDDPRFAGKDVSIKHPLMPEGTPNWVELLKQNPAPDSFLK